MDFHEIQKEADIGIPSIPVNRAHDQVGRPPRAEMVVAAKEIPEALPGRIGANQKEQCHQRNRQPFINLDVPHLLLLYIMVCYKP